MTRETQRKLVWPALLLVLACVQAVNAQDGQLPQPSPTPLTAPPPFKMIVKEERDQIDQTGDASRRLKLTITFAGAHLTAAEQHTSRENYEAASVEVGMYHALIENALKFRYYQDSARIEIGSEEDDQEYRFFVRDNGIGIDPRFHESIFDLFYRLQDLKNVEGTGVGLTIVQRVLQTYGGRIWLNSEKGKGATFFVAIPRTI